MAEVAERKREVVFFADSSTESRRIQHELDARQIEHVSLRRSSSSGRAPALQVGGQMISGASPILRSLDRIEGRKFKKE